MTNMTMEKTASITFRLVPEQKKKFEQIVEGMGLSVSTALNCFVNRTVNAKGIPFVLSVEDHPSAELMEAIEEADEIVQAVRTMTYKGKKYDDRDEILADIQRDVDREFAQWEAEQEDE